MSTPFVFSNKNRTLRIYNYQADTGEFIGEADAFIPANTGLPAYCTLEVPPKLKGGHIAVFNGEKWLSLEDLRGTVVYNTQTGEPQTINQLGSLPENTTLLAPTSPFDRWNGTKWVKDSEAEKQYYLAEARQKKSILLEEANTQIEILKDSIEFDMSTPTAESELVTWRKYRVQLSQLDISAAPDIDWPKQPA
ncbi:tail assembly chaperone [Yersinia frederiksenii]|nr:tail assembly chaperone [Yersinia frederiksenii]